MSHQSAAAQPQSLPAGESREHRDLGREVSETRGEFRSLKWASALAFVAIVGTMGFFYQALDTFDEGQKDIRQSLGAIYQQTITLGERLDRQYERLDRQDGRLRHVEHGFVEVNGRLDQMDGRLRHVENGLVEVNGRLEQMDGRLANVEELLRVLVARSADPS